MKDPIEQLRRITYVGVGLCIAASVVSAALLGTGWSWLLFGWGVLIGPLWVAATTGAYRFAGRQVLGAAPPASRLSAIYPAWAAMGIPFGVFSAAFGTAAPDAGLTIYAVIATVVPLARVPALRRRFAAATTRNDCPFSGACGSACAHPKEECP